MNPYENKSPFKAVCVSRWTYPVVNFSRNELRYCCRTPGVPCDKEELSNLGAQYFENNSYLITRRKEMLNEERHPDCNGCWHLEDQGLNSPRSDPKPFTELLQQLKIDGQTLHAKPKTLEVSLNSVCNMKCMYCSHHYSTSWADEHIRFGELDKDQYRLENQSPDPVFQENFWVWLEKKAIHSLDEIGVLGGEPLLSSEFYTFCDRLIEIVKKSNRKSPLRLSIVTNLNINDLFMSRFLSYLPKLAELFDINLSLSIESLENRAEYIRYGLKWNLWLKNFERLLATNPPRTILSLQISMNILNITSLEPFLRFFYHYVREFKAPVYLRRSLVTDPDVHSYLNLTSDFHKYLKNAEVFLTSIEKDVVHLDSFIGGWMYFRDFVGNMAISLKKNSPSQAQLSKVYQWFNKHDHRRGTDIITVFPELGEYWTQCARAYANFEGQKEFA